MLELNPDPKSFVFPILVLIKLLKMREITLKIPEEKFEFYMELFEQLGLETEIEYDIPEGNKDILRERIRNSKPENLIPWKKAKKMLNHISDSDEV